MYSSYIFGDAGHILIHMFVPSSVIASDINMYGYIITQIIQW